MPRDGGFHPFKGRVSRHFGDSVCFVYFTFTLQISPLCGSLLNGPSASVTLWATEDQVRHMNVDETKTRTLRDQKLIRVLYSSPPTMHT